MKRLFHKYFWVLTGILFLFFAGLIFAAEQAAADSKSQTDVHEKTNSVKAAINLSGKEQEWLSRHKTIRVAFDGYFPPYSFLNDKGKLEGLAVDIMLLAASRAGISLEIYPKFVWNDLFEAAKQKDVDVVATMGHQPWREQWFLFTRPYIFKSLVIMTRTEEQLINAPADLAGRTVAVVKSYQYVKTLLEKYPSIKPYYVDTMLDGLNAVAVGKADSAITFLGAGYYLKTKYQISNIKFAAIYERDRFTDSIAVRKDWPELAAILDKALASISPGDMLTIQKKWLPTEELIERPVLTSEEKTWLQEHPVIRLAPEREYAPFTFVDTDGVHSGFSADLIALLEQSIGIKFTVLEAADLFVNLQKIREGKADLLTSLSFSSERSEYLLFTKPYISVPAVIIVRKEVKGVLSVDDLMKKRIAVGKEYTVQSFLMRKHAGLMLVPLDNDLECLNAVSFGDVDAAIVDVASASYLISRRGIANLRIAGDIGFEYNLSLASRKDWPVFNQILEKGLASISPKVRQELYKKWIGIEPVKPLLSRRMAYILLSFLGFIAVSLVIVFIWNRALKYKVKVKTKELQEELAARIKAEDELEKHREHLEELVTERTTSLEEKTSELERSQTALQYLLEDVKEAKKELEKANEKLKELDRLKSMFIASMSHELRTPLNSIIGFTGIILQGMAGKINEEQRDQLQRVSSAGKHLLALITDVIDIAKIESGNLQPYAEEFMLEDVIDEACESIKVQIKEKGLELQKIAPDLPVQMKTDRRRLLQCLLNLLSNAVKFIEKGFVRISARLVRTELDDFDYVEIIIEDTGIGIKPEDMHLLFKSFVRLESHLKTTTSGTGLGLYLTKKLVTETLKGEIMVESGCGKGSSFKIRMPVKI